MALQKQTIALQFRGGLDSKTDDKSVSATKLLGLENGRFGSPGKITKRPGHGRLSRNLSTGSAAATGETTIADGQALMRYRDGLLAVGKRDDAQDLYSYSAGSSDWTWKGAAPSVRVTTADVFAAGYADSTNPDGATHEETGLQVVVFNVGPSSAGVHYCVIDSSTGETIVGATLLAANGIKPRVLVVNNVFLLYYYDTTLHQLFVSSLAVGNPTATLVPAAITSDGANAGSFDTTYPFYDVAIIESAAVGKQIYLAFNNRLASYGTSLWRFAVASPTIAVEQVSIVGERSFVLTVFEDRYLNRVVLAYWNGSAVLFRVYEPALNDASDVPVIVQFGVVETVGSVVSITGASRSSTAVAVDFFYTTGNAATFPEGMDQWRVRKNAITSPTWTASALGVAMGVPFGAAGVDVSSLAGDFLRSVSLAAKAFFVGAASYVPLIYRSATQGTYFLANNSRAIVARWMGAEAGDGDPDFVSTTVALGGVATVDATSRRVLVTRQHYTGAVQSSAGATPSVGVASVLLDFFEPEQSYLRAEIAGSLHLNGSFLSMYDGVSIVEHGFHLAPEDVAPIDSGSGKTYSYVAVYEWLDNNGRLHRSAPSLPATRLSTDAIDGVHPATVYVSTLRLTAKQDDFLTPVRTPVTIALYRTENNGTVYYRTYSAIANNNPAVDYLTFSDTTTDAELIGYPPLYTTGGVVENVATPPVGALCVHRNRLFIVDPDGRTISYSNQIGENEPVEFQDGATVRPDPVGGGVTALASLDEKLIEFKASSIFSRSGQGPDRLGTNNDFSDAQLVNTVCGCTAPRSIVTVPMGLMFKSAKGFMLLGRDLSVSYIGADVERYNGETVTSGVLLEDTNEVRFTLGNGVALVYDYLAGQWDVDSGIDAVDSVIWQGSHAFLRDDASVMLEDVTRWTDAGSHVPLRVKTAWIQVAGQQGVQRIWRINILGEYRGPHKLRVGIAYDFNPAIVQQVEITASGPAAYGDDSPYGSGSPYGGTFPLYQWDVRPSMQKCSAIQLTIEDAVNGAPGESMSLSGIALEVGVDKGVRRLSAARTLG